MTYLLDTNVLSELRKPANQADPHVLRWFGRRRSGDLYLCAVTILEVEIGIGRLARRDRPRANRLRAWLDDDVLDVFRQRILPIDVQVARAAARLHVPDPRPERDALIAATAQVHDLTVVTRNVADFEPLGVALVNPWLPEPGSV